MKRIDLAVIAAILQFAGVALTLYIVLKTQK